MPGKKASYAYSKLWRESPNRDYFAALCLTLPITMTPEHTTLKDGIEPALGEWPRLRTHIHEVLADGDEALADYIIRWAAWSFQNPPRHCVALAFKGG